MTTKQKPNPKTGKTSFDETSPQDELARTRKALEDIVVAIRGGGNLSAAAVAAQAVLDGKPAAPNFASDEAGELALKLNGEGKLSTAQIAAIQGSGADGAITVKDINKAAGIE